MIKNNTLTHLEFTFSLEYCKNDQEFTPNRSANIHCYNIRDLIKVSYMIKI